MLTESSSSVALVIPNLPILLSTSEDTRTGVVVALSQQYQRLLQAKPLRLQIEATPSGLPGMVQSLLKIPLGPFNGLIIKTKDHFECSSCKFREPISDLTAVHFFRPKDGTCVAVPQISKIPWHNYTPSAFCEVPILAQFVFQKRSFTLKVG